MAVALCNRHPQLLQGDAWTRFSWRGPGPPTLKRSHWAESSFLSPPWWTFADLLLLSVMQCFSLCVFSSPLLRNPLCDVISLLFVGVCAIPTVLALVSTRERREVPTHQFFNCGGFFSISTMGLVILGLFFHSSHLHGLSLSVCNAQSMCLDFQLYFRTEIPTSFGVFAVSGVINALVSSREPHVMLRHQCFKVVVPRSLLSALKSSAAPVCVLLSLSIICCSLGRLCSFLKRYPSHCVAHLLHLLLSVSPVLSLNLSSRCACVHLASMAGVTVQCRTLLLPGCIEFPSVVARLRWPSSLGRVISVPGVCSVCSSTLPLAFFSWLAALQLSPSFVSSDCVVLFLLRGLTILVVGVRDIGSRRGVKSSSTCNDSVQRVWSPLRDQEWPLRGCVCEPVCSLYSSMKLCAFFPSSQTLSHLTRPVWTNHRHLCHFFAKSIFLLFAVFVLAPSPWLFFSWLAALQLLELFLD